MSDCGHGFVTTEPFDRHDVTPTAHGNHGAVHATPGRVLPDDHRRGHVFPLVAFHGVIYEVWCDELVLAGLREIPIDLDPGLIGVLAVLIDNLLVNRFVGALDGAGVDLL